MIGFSRGVSQNLVRLDVVAGFGAGLTGQNATFAAVTDQESQKC
jgi:hypothetical protein